MGLRDVRQPSDVLSIDLQLLCVSATALCAPALLHGVPVSWRAATLLI
jgi:hypothetical protein